MSLNFPNYSLSNYLNKTHKNNQKQLFHNLKYNRILQLNKTTKVLMTFL